METVEVEKKVIKVRHLYDRQEVFHRFIHSREVVYSNRNYPVTAAHDFLFCYCVPINKNNPYWLDKSREEYANSWMVYQDKLLAVINRTDKKIIVRYGFYAKDYELKLAIPYDYEVLYSLKPLDPNVLSTGDYEQAYKLHAEFLISQVVMCYDSCYFALDDSSRTSVATVGEINNNAHPIKALKEFAKVHNLSQYSWYNEVINKDQKVYKYKGWTKKDIKTVTPPSVKQVLENKVFTVPEKVIIEKKHFYGKYCYSYGIGWQELLKHYYDDFDKDYFNKICKARNITVNFNNCKTWKDGIIALKDYEDKFFIKRNDECIQLSNANEAAARKLYTEYIQDPQRINDWREGKDIHTKRFEFQEYVPAKGKIGRWRTSYFNTYYFNDYTIFSYIQLRLKDHQVETSHYARVGLNEAIRGWGLFQRGIDICKKQNTNYLNLEDKNIKIGIYGVKHIKYTNKCTYLDPRNTGTNMQWLIQIGCHTIWYDDIINFIEYYKLEDKFKL